MVSSCTTLFSTHNWSSSFWGIHRAFRFSQNESLFLYPAGSKSEWQWGWFHQQSAWCKSGWSEADFISSGGDSHKSRVLTSHVSMHVLIFLICFSPEKFLTIYLWQTKAFDFWQKKTMPDSRVHVFQETVLGSHAPLVSGILSISMKARSKLNLSSFQRMFVSLLAGWWILTTLVTRDFVRREIEIDDERQDSHRLYISASCAEKRRVSERLCGGQKKAAGLLFLFCCIWNHNFPSWKTRLTCPGLRVLTV